MLDFSFKALRKKYLYPVKVLIAVFSAKVLKVPLQLSVPC